MSQPDSQRVQELFIAALELPSDERDTWLVHQCGPDTNLLNEVRSLLAHDDPVADPLEAGLADTQMADAIAAVSYTHLRAHET